MGTVELCRFLDRRLLQHQHVDDLLIHDRQRPFMVAGMDLCLAWLCHRWFLHLSDGSYRCRLPHWFPRRWTVLFWHLG